MGNFKTTCNRMDRFLNNGESYKKQIHFSVDDCIGVFRWITKNNPESIFDTYLFSTLLNWHNEFDLKVTLYMFFDDGNGFNITKIPSKYIKELEENSSWIYFGYHGVNSNENITCVKRFKNELSVFNNVFKNQSQIWRMHFFKATKEEIALIKANGVNTLLCPDDSRTSVYDLKTSEFEFCYNSGNYQKNGMNYSKTDIRFDNYKKVCNIPDLNKENVVAFVHEWCFKEKSELVYDFFDFLKDEIVFVF